MAHAPLFADRAAAGRALAGVLPPFEEAPVVAGLARGGVPVAAEVARALSAPLDVLVVRKVGHPTQPEYALGAVSEDGLALPEGMHHFTVAEHVLRARRQAQALRGARPRVALAGRAVVVVDDGLATGRSMAVALETVRRAGAARVVMAVPVASGPGFRELSAGFEAVAVAVIEPPDFFAVGQFYADFAQVGDDAVAALLEG